MFPIWENARERMFLQRGKTADFRTGDMVSSCFPANDGVNNQICAQVLSWAISPYMGKNMMIVTLYGIILWLL